MNKKNFGKTSLAIDYDYEQHKNARLWILRVK